MLGGLAASVPGEKKRAMMIALLGLPPPPVYPSRSGFDPFLVWNVKFFFFCPPSNPPAQCFPGWSFSPKTTVLSSSLATFFLCLTSHLVKPPRGIQSYGPLSPNQTGFPSVFFPPAKNKAPSKDFFFCLASFLEIVGTLRLWLFCGD